MNAQGDMEIANQDKTLMRPPSAIISDGRPARSQ
jgi:hypothetical protein